LPAQHLCDEPTPGAGDGKWILSFPNPRSVLNPRGATRLPIGLPELNIEDEATGRETELRHVIA